MCYRQTNDEISSDERFQNLDGDYVNQFSYFYLKCDVVLLDFEKVFGVTP